MSRPAKTAEGSARKQAPRASLSTLSAYLGLSTAAISRVLSGVPAAKSIPKTTQDRIFAAAKQFDYRPNAAARSLRHGRSMTIGVMVPEISEGYATLVLSGVEQRLLEAGYIYFLLSHHHREEVIERSRALLLDRSVEGMIAIDTPLRTTMLLPTVTVSCPVSFAGVTNIVLDHEVAAQLAIDHLQALGHREIAVIKGQVFSSDTLPRWKAIQTAAGRAGIDIDLTLVDALEGEMPTHEPGYLSTQRLLARKQRFTALIAFNDVSAIGAIRALREGGLRVPHDVSVVGFDDVQSSGFQNPSLTTVRQPLREMGTLAADAVLEKIERKTEQTEIDLRVVLPKLIVRESTAVLDSSYAK